MLRKRQSDDAAPVVAVLAVHPGRVAGTRLRALQYGPALAAVGLELRLWSLFAPEHLSAWFGRSNVRRALVLLRALLRLPSAVLLVQRADVVVVLREALPFGPPWLEWLARRRSALVWDVDDAIWESFASPTAGHVPQWVRGTWGKYHWLASHADEVWAGSEVLARWCSEHSRDVYVIPTVVPVPTSRPAMPRERSVGWVGTHATAKFVEPILVVLADQPHAPPVSVVGAEVAKPPRLPLVVEAWSPEAEERLLESVRVGLYPIDRLHPLAEGKCGLKAILYMSHGLPQVITPTVTNSSIVRDGLDGLHADTPAEWRAAVNRLLDDEDLWQRLSQAAHQRALECFSLQRWAPVVAGRLAGLVGHRGTGRDE
jgi:glycosyltransferase involved in cell wall biosynthesis